MLKSLLMHGLRVENTLAILQNIVPTLSVRIEILKNDETSLLNDPPKMVHRSTVKWADFIKNYTSYITSACNRQDNIDNYDITKNIS